MEFCIKRDAPKFFAFPKEMCMQRLKYMRSSRSLAIFWPISGFGLVNLICQENLLYISNGESNDNNLLLMNGQPISNPCFKLCTYIHTFILAVDLMVSYNHCDITGFFLIKDFKKALSYKRNLLMCYGVKHVRYNNLVIALGNN